MHGSSQTLLTTSSSSMGILLYVHFYAKAKGMAWVCLQAAATKLVSTLENSLSKIQKHLGWFKVLFSCLKGPRRCQYKSLQATTRWSDYQEMSRACNEKTKTKMKPRTKCFYQQGWSSCTLRWAELTNPTKTPPQKLLIVNLINVC